MKTFWDGSLLIDQIMSSTAFDSELRPLQLEQNDTYYASSEAPRIENLTSSICFIIILNEKFYDRRASTCLMNFSYEYNHLPSF